MTVADKNEAFELRIPGEGATLRDDCKSSTIT